MTPSFVVKWGTEFLIHMSARFEWSTKRVGHAMDSAAAFDFTGATEGGYTTRFVMCGDTLGTGLELE